MAVSIDRFAKVCFRLFFHFEKPIGRYQLSGIGVRIGEGKNTPFQVFYSAELTCLIHNQIGLVKMTFLNPGGGD